MWKSYIFLFNFAKQIDTSMRYSYKDLDNNNQYGQASLEELQTVGFFDNYRFTENKIRKEHGLGWRRIY